MPDNLGKDSCCSIYCTCSFGYFGQCNWPVAKSTDQFNASRLVSGLLILSSSTEFMRNSTGLFFMLKWDWNETIGVVRYQKRFRPTVLNWLQSILLESILDLIFQQGLYREKKLDLKMASKTTTITYL